MKKVYSLNLAAYIMLQTNLEPELELDTNDTSTLVSMVFPECAAVAAAIRSYKEDSELHSFLHKYKELRDIINEARGE